MKLRTLVLALFLCQLASAQFIGPFAITSAQCTQPIDATGIATVGIVVNGTWSGTLQPEASIQGQTRFNVQATPSTSSTPQSTITADGGYVVSVAGWSTFVLCGNTVATGQANVYLNPSTVSTGGGGTSFPAANPLGSLQGNDGGAFAGVPGSLINFIGTGPLLSLTADIANNDIQQWYVSGQVNPNFGIDIFNYGDTQGLGFFLQSSLGEQTSIDPRQISLSTPTVSIQIKPTASSFDILAIGPQGTEVTNPTISTAGDTSGHDIQQWLTSGTGKTAWVDTSGGFHSITFNTETNCSAVGSSANPSLIACGTAASGTFSVAVAASTGTAVVSTTAVSANSNIFLQIVHGTTVSTRLGVTCNGNDVQIGTLRPHPNVIVPGVSFTVDVPGAITVDPMCISYFIVN